MVSYLPVRDNLSFASNGDLVVRPAHLDPIPKPPHQQYYGLVTNFAKNHGDIAAALSSQEQMQAIYPESARPAFTLTHGRYSDFLTVKDIVLFEILVSHARAIGAQDRPIAVPVRHLLETLGWAGNKRYLEASIDRLRRATYKVRYSNSRNIALGYRFSADGEFPLIDSITHIAYGDPKKVPDFRVRGDHLLFKIGDDMRRFQQCRLRYHYVEIGAMAKMASKFSLRLYQHLVYQTWNTSVDTRPGMPGEKTGYTWTIDPRKLARRIGWLKRSDNFNFAVFQREILDRAMKDLSHVRAFSTSFAIERGPGRGNPVATLTFSLHPAVPDWRRLKSVAMSSLPSEERDQLAVPDDPKLKPRIAIFLRAARYFGTSAAALHQAWQVALYEALHQVPVNADVETRATRGDQLLAALTERDPSDIAWSFIKDEMNAPSLISLSDRRWGCAAALANTERARTAGLIKMTASERALTAARTALFGTAGTELLAETEVRLERSRVARDKAKRAAPAQALSHEEYEEMLAQAQIEAGYEPPPEETWEEMLSAMMSKN